jgi:hypothetical protein
MPLIVKPYSFKTNCMKHFITGMVLLSSFVAMAQNVGIGTTTPTSRLHVADSSANTFLLVESPTASADNTGLILRTGSNIFNSLTISKYGTGALGTFAGLPKDNLSVITTGGNAGTLLINNGDGTSPIVFAAGAGEQMRINANSRVGIGTSTPANKLHVHDEEANQDASIVLTNNLTGTNALRGGRFRFLNSDLLLYNYEAAGKIHFVTAFNTRMTIDAAGNVGIGTPSPSSPLEVVTAGNTYGIKVDNSNNIALGVFSLVTGTTETVAFAGNSSNNSNGTNISTGVHGRSGTGGTFLAQNSSYGVKGESLNTTRGVGVFGGSNSGSANLAEAAVLGINWSTGSDVYGIIGKSSGTSSGAGTVGYTANATAGLLGYAHFTSTGPAIKSTSLAGSAQIGLELENGAIKVSGTNRTVFQHEATAGNTSFNETVIPNTTLANSASDLLIITPYWDGVYVNAPIGVYFAGGTWRIFRQDAVAMPVGAKFNVLVVKQ